MKKTMSKTQAKEKIEEFFKKIKLKSPKEIKKIKKLAMSFKIPLKEKRKLFCKYCFSPYSTKEKIRIKISRWKID
jgi:RNase P subunit RPR2